MTSWSAHIEHRALVLITGKQLIVVTIDCGWKSFLTGGLLLHSNRSRLKTSTFFSSTSLWFVGRQILNLTIFVDTNFPNVMLAKLSHTHTHTHAHTQTHILTCTHTHIHNHTQTHTHKHTHANTQAHTYTQLHVYMCLECLHVHVLCYENW